VTNHLERVGVAGASVGAQKELERHRWRKFWRTAEAAVHRVVISDHAGVRRIEQLGLDRMIGTTGFTQTAQLSD